MLLKLVEIADGNHVISGRLVGDGLNLLLVNVVSNSYDIDSNTGLSCYICSIDSGLAVNGSTIGEQNCNSGNIASSSTGCREHFIGGKFDRIGCVCSSTGHMQILYGVQNVTSITVKFEGEAHHWVAAVLHDTNLNLIVAYVHICDDVFQSVLGFLEVFASNTRGRVYHEDNIGIVETSCWSWKSRCIWWQLVTNFGCKHVRQAVQGLVVIGKHGVSEVGVAGDGSQLIHVNAAADADGVDDGVVVFRRLGLQLGDGLSGGRPVSQQDGNVRHIPSSSMRRTEALLRHELNGISSIGVTREILNATDRMQNVVFAHVIIEVELVVNSGTEREGTNVNLVLSYV